ncbi:hypothetical protein CAEBREN_10243 [Caenorhabditis brenneri]|uniref:Uncharacterized protein n=1 Tax=Caenorhabditis brenneri TaxID=135651 RepID=G0NGC4_CAEBE|nr:hypothetical protein CAEBREN_10243 [Caenorhabditis brenneri]
MFKLFVLMLVVLLAINTHGYIVGYPTGPDAPLVPVKVLKTTTTTTTTPAPHTMSKAAAGPASKEDGVVLENDEDDAVEAATGAAKGPHRKETDAGAPAGPHHKDAGAGHEDAAAGAATQDADAPIEIEGVVILSVFRKNFV